jgi:hypothetical protein
VNTFGPGAATVTSAPKRSFDVKVVPGGPAVSSTIDSPPYSMVNGRPATNRVGDARSPVTVTVGGGMGAVPGGHGGGGA